MEGWQRYGQKYTSHSVCLPGDVAMNIHARPQSKRGGEGFGPATSALLKAFIDEGGATRINPFPTAGVGHHPVKKAGPPRYQSPVYKMTKVR